MDNIHQMFGFVIQKSEINFLIENTTIFKDDRKDG